MSHSVLEVPKLTKQLGGFLSNCIASPLMITEFDPKKKGKSTFDIQDSHLDGIFSSLREATGLSVAYLEVNFIELVKKCHQLLVEIWPAIKAELGLSALEGTYESFASFTLNFQMPVRILGDCSEGSTIA